MKKERLLPSLRNETSYTFLRFMYSYARMKTAIRGFLFKYKRGENVKKI